MEKRRYPVRKTPSIPKADMVFGVQSVMETLRSGKEIERLLIQKDQLMPDLQKLAVELQVPLAKVPIEKLNRITRKNHQGVI